jgi:hypothetical protein
LVGAFLISSLLGVILLTRDDNKVGEASSTLSRPSIKALSTSSTLNPRVEVLERLRNILRIRDEAFQDRDAEILRDVYTNDCPCLEGDGNAIQELINNSYHMVGGATSIKLQKASQVNERLWLVIADFRSAPLRIETEDNKLVRGSPPAVTCSSLRWPDRPARESGFLAEQRHTRMIQVDGPLECSAPRRGVCSCCHDVYIGSRFYDIGRRVFRRLHQEQHCWGGKPRQIRTSRSSKRLLITISRHCQRNTALFYSRAVVLHR